MNPTIQRQSHRRLASTIGFRGRTNYLKSIGSRAYYFQFILIDDSPMKHPPFSFRPLKPAASPKSAHSHNFSHILRVILRFLTSSFTDIIRKDYKQKEMMSNQNGYPPTRHHPMSTSAMFYPNSGIEQRRPTNFPTGRPNNTLFQPDPSPAALNSSAEFYPKALASQSMIATNSASGRRAPIGKLDSMARNVTTMTKVQSSTEPSSKTTSVNLQEESPPQIGRILEPTYKNPFLGFQKYQERLKLQTQPAQPNKKRRESIDIGLANRAERVSEIQPFIRRTQNPTQSIAERQEKPTEHQIITNNIEALKQKQFQFMKKRKELTVTDHTLGAQSMKNLQNSANVYSPIATMRKPEFLTPNYSRPPAVDVKCPEDKSKLETPIKESSSGTPNFEFKKKKFFESPFEPGSSKSVMYPRTPPSAELITAKDRRNSRPQRQIQLSDFEMIKKLGKGAFGEVYLALDKSLGFLCVIKKMLKQRIFETKVELHILREIKIQSYLNNGHLTALYGYFHDEQYVYLILEALPDGSLQQVKKKRKLPEKEAAAIVKQVTDGLKYMHEEYIIHRDLKPQNIFVYDGYVKIGDFGCSIYNHDLGLRTTVVGCLEYSSPEQLSKQGYSDKIDSWSLGILTYELLFGKSPFESDIIKITKNKEQKAELSELSFPASIPVKEETKRFIENLLLENPEQRMDMDEVLAHPFLKEEVSKKPVVFDLF